MFTYGIGILLLIKTLKAGFTDLTNPWYVENGGALGIFARIKSYFNSLKQHDLGQDITQNPLKAL